MNTKWTLLALLLFILPGVAGAGTSNEFDGIIHAYESIRLALLQDTVEGVEESTLLLRQRAEEAARAEATAEELRPQLTNIAALARIVAEAEDLEGTREAFFELSKTMVRYRSNFSGDGLPLVMYCPMAKKSWLQLDEEPGNPYYGKAMANCGNVVEGK